MSWMIYGANGYTGRLLARKAVDAGERPILAGRSQQAVGALAEALGLPYRVADLHDPVSLDNALEGITAVAHCAGPFTVTALPMVRACLRNGVHYVDVTGEIEVFEAIYALHADAEAAGVALVPGGGFDVVPTDYLVATLAATLPGATQADVGIVSRGGFSAGTLKTGIEGVSIGNRARVDGKVAQVPLCHRKLRLPLPHGPVTVYSVPLGDVASAYRATAIPNVTTFTTVPAGFVARAAEPVLTAGLRVKAIRSLVDNVVGRAVRGPSAAKLANTRSELWVELRDAQGAAVSASIEVPNTYEFTARSMLHAVLRLQDGGVAAGAWAPTQAFGTDFLLTIPGIDVTHGPQTDSRSGRP